MITSRDDIRRFFTHAMPEFKPPEAILLIQENRWGDWCHFGVDDRRWPIYEKFLVNHGNYNLRFSPILQRASHTSALMPSKAGCAWLETDLTRSGADTVTRLLTGPIPPSAMLQAGEQIVGFWFLERPAIYDTPEWALLGRVLWKLKHLYAALPETATLTSLVTMPGSMVPANKPGGRAYYIASQHTEEAQFLRLSEEHVSLKQLAESLGLTE